jgi:8-oxo-dGTP pyrophosphatase MutT (NUDIX family)
MIMPMIINNETLIERLPALHMPIAQPDTEESLQASAVLLALHHTDQQWKLLLTTRADHLKNHAGQISFPGGRFEHIDQHLMATAVRETEEEVGLDKKYIRVISQLDDHDTLTGFRIFPYVAIVNELPELTIDKNEVENVFSVPLAHLIDSSNHQVESVTYKGMDYDYYKIVWQDKIIWGATAKMIVNLSKYF